MENTARTLERENLSLQASPTSNITSSNIENPPTPKAISISITSDSPTTFIQADTNSFKQVVQMLTGSSETTKHAPKLACPGSPKPAGPARAGQKRPGFKLQERRNSLRNLKIIPGLALNSLLSPSQDKIVSPSVLDLHNLVLSPLTPSNSETINRSSQSSGDDYLSSLEEKAIAEKGFYLHASPLTTPRGSEPQLLPLFPVTSPKVSGTFWEL